MKKIWQRALCLVMALLMVPALAPADLAAALPMTQAYAADTVINSAEDWKKFAQSETGNETVRLGADITLSDEVPTKRYFYGTFDGQGHTITLAKDSVLQNHADSASVGLFARLSGATVKNLVIRVEGMVNATDLTSLKITEGNTTDQSVYQCGVLAGYSDECTIQRVAVTSGESGGTFRAVLNRWQVEDGNVGGLCGLSSDDTIDQCYVGVNVQSWRMIDNSESSTTLLRTGGLAGFATGSSKITNCMVHDAEIRTYHSNPDILNNTGGQAAGLVCGLDTGVQLMNCVLDGVKIYSHDVAETTRDENTPVDQFEMNSASRGTAGLSYALTSGYTAVSNCYAYGDTMIVDTGIRVTSGTISTQDAADSAKRALATTSSTTWLTDNNGWLGLSWMFQTPQLTLAPTLGGRDMTLTVSQKEPVISGGAETTWDYTIKASLQGRYGSPTAPELVKGVTPAVTKVEILESRTTGDDITPGTQEYYSGGTYQFYAKVTGVNLAGENTPVSWELVDVPTDDVQGAAATISATGELKVKETYFGDLTIQATAGGKSAICTLTVLPAKLTILVPGNATTVEQGRQIDLGVQFEGFFSDASKKPYKIDWALATEPVKPGTTIVSAIQDDAPDGLLTVADNETEGKELKITAKLRLDSVEAGEEDLLQEQSVTLTVEKSTTPAQVEKKVKPAQTSETQTVGLKTGQQLKVSLDSNAPSPQTPQGYEKDGEPTLTAAITAGGEFLTQDTQDEFLFTAEKAGTATITVTRTFTYKKTETTEPGGGTSTDTGTSTDGGTTPSVQADDEETKVIEYTSELTVNILDFEVPKAEDSVKKMTSVAGKISATQYETQTVEEYRLNFPTGPAGRRYQLAVQDPGSEPTPGASWQDLKEAAESVVLDETQVKALSTGTLYLWIYQQSSSDMAASSAAGYSLKEEGGKLTLTALEKYPASEKLDPKSDITYKGQWTVRNGAVEGGPTFSVLELMKKLDSGLGGYISLNTGEVRVTVSQASGNYSSGGKVFTTEVSCALAVGDAMLKPTIQPRGGQLTGNCFTIDVPDQPDCVVYYQIYPGQSTVDPEAYPKPETGILYNPGTEIPYPTGGHTVVTVVAVTYPSDASSGALPSEADSVTFGSDNLEPITPPQLCIGDTNEEFVGSKQYMQGETFRFVYGVGAQSNSYQVYYTTDGSDPNCEDPNQLYDSDNPPVLEFGNARLLDIRAVVYDLAYKQQSMVARFVVERLSSAGKPTASEASGSLVRPGQAVYLELEESFVASLPEMGNFLSAQYAEYSADSPVYAEFADYIRSGSDEPMEGVRYLIIDTGTSVSTVQLPEMRYLLNNDEGTLETDGVPYKYGLCQIWNLPDEEGERQYYIAFTNSDPITLSGASGDTFTLRAATYAPEGVNSYLDSEEVTFNYTIRGTLPAPGAVPTTDAQGATAVDIGEGISLTGAANTEIFYTTNGMEPQVVWVETATPESAVTGHWEPANDYTQKYETTLYVPNNNSKLFVLNAIAVSVDDSLENSPLASFVYSVNPLPQAAAPQANPATDGTQPTRLSNGERITLTTTTLNTDIYYTTDGSVPSYDARDAWDAGYAAAAEADKGQDQDGTRWYTDADGVRQNEPATRIYDVQQGITMAATEQSQFFTVTAMAVDRDRTTPAAAASNAASFVYRLAQVEAPTGSPATSDTEVTVLEPGTTIVLTCGTVGAKIYYTKDTTMPDVTDLAAVDSAYAKWYKGYTAAAEKDRGTDTRGVRWYRAGGTVYNEPSTIPYDAAEGIVMPKTISTFLTLRAVAVIADGTRAASDVVTISYQPPAPVQAVYASPVDGTAVEYGTAVTLSCATEGAQIFYKVYTSAPAADDVPVVNKDLGYTDPITITKEVWIRAVAVRSNVESTVTTYHYTVAPTAQAPTASLSSGSVVPKGTRIRLSGDGTIVYTLDGSDPKDEASEKLYGNTVNLDGAYGATVALRAYIQKDGCTPSDTVSFNYTICAEEDYLTISTENGAVIADGTAMTLSTAITNGRIFYTLDGSTPQVVNVYSGEDGQSATYQWAPGSSSTIEGSGFTLTGAPDSTAVVRAIVVTDGGDGGQVYTFTYKFQSQAAPPTASIPTGAVVFAGATVTLTAQEGAIYYTTDGSTPTTASAVYNGPIDVSAESGTVLRAIAVVDGKAASNVAEFRYTRAGQVGAPVFSIPSGEIETGTAVSITSATEGAVIYYSTDGTEPSSSNLKELAMYVAPITITRAVTIKAIAVSDKLNDSIVQSATYTVKNPEPQPTAEPDADQPQTTVTDRLTSRRTYTSTDDGPSYSDVVLRESAGNTVLSADKGIVPDGALLSVKQVEPTRSDATSVKSSLGQDVAVVYETQLTVDGDSVSPTGEFELGFAIPAEYQNGVVTISRINDDGTLTQYTARRSGGMAYIKTSEMGRYALSVPQAQGASSGLLTALLWAGGITAAVLGLILVILYRRRRRQAEAAAAAAAAADDDEYQSLEEFFEPSDI